MSPIVRRVINLFKPVDKSLPYVVHARSIADELQTREPSEITYKQIEFAQGFVKNKIPEILNAHRNSYASSWIASGVATFVAFIGVGGVINNPKDGYKYPTALLGGSTASVLIRRAKKEEKNIEQLQAEALRIERALSGYKY